MIHLFPLDKLYLNNEPRQITCLGNKIGSWAEGRVMNCNNIDAAVVRVEECKQEWTLGDINTDESSFNIHVLVFKI